MSDPSVADLEANVLAKIRPAVEAEVRNKLTQHLADLADQEKLSPAQAVTIKQLIDARFAQDKGWKNRLKTWAPIIISLIALAVAMTQAHYAQKNLQNNLIYTMQKDQRLAILDYASNRTGVEYIFAQMQSIYIQQQQGSIPEGVWAYFLKDFCSVMQRENFRRSWNETYKEKEAAFAKDFADFMVRLQNPDSAECKGRK
jgi:hypothetical protein